MKVYLTFDVEVWCGSWSDLDARFPAAFERYCWGRSAAGDYALPKTLEIMRGHGLVGVFFVEPLFSARFGTQWLDTMVGLIHSAGQDVQLHLHPEWTDEIMPPPIADASRKRQLLVHYNLDEQTELIRVGRALLEGAKGSPVEVFRAGSFAANRDTYRALARNGLFIDSSLNARYDSSQGTIDEVDAFASRRSIEGVQVHPVTVLRDGFGRLRAAQVNGCTFAELRAALLAAEDAGVEHFVLVSHNFEMLKPGSCDPDWTVVRRFEALCEFLGRHPQRFEVGPFAAAPAADDLVEPRPSVGALLTAQRHLEQALRRLR